MKRKVIRLDVSELEAPLPLVKGVEAMRDLKDDEVLLFIHRMFPCKLQDQVDAFGYKSQIIKNEENCFEMKIIKS